MLVRICSGGYIEYELCSDTNALQAIDCLFYYMYTSAQGMVTVILPYIVEIFGTSNYSTLIK